jgi:hypothetical protein
MGNWVTGGLAIVAVVVAAVAAFYARKQANAAHNQVEAAQEAIRVARDAAAAAARQAEAFAGAQSAIAWRDQVVALYERGLRPDQIRFIMHLENGGAGYEGWNGSIDDIVCGLPQPGRASATLDEVVPGSCPVMPRSLDGCTGDCRAALDSSGCSEYRTTSPLVT